MNNEPQKAGYGKLREAFRKSLRIQERTVCRVMIVLEFNGTPDLSELQEIIEKCRETAGVEVADYQHLAPTTESLV